MVKGRYENTYQCTESSPYFIGHMNFLTFMGWRNRDSGGCFGVVVFLRYMCNVYYLSHTTSGTIRLPVHC